MTKQTEYVSWSMRPNGERIKTRFVLPPGQPTRRRRQDAFVQVPLHLANEFAVATNTRKALVWLVILYEDWKSGGKPFALSNNKLAGFKVTRFMKYRALADLESAGKIRVAQRGKSTSVVTVLKPRTKSRRRPGR